MCRTITSLFGGACHPGWRTSHPLAHLTRLRISAGGAQRIVAYNTYLQYRIMSTDDKVTVSAAEFHRNVGLYQDIALTKPVTITKNGRERTVLLSAQEYARLKRRDRRVIAAGELSERQVDAIRNARVPDRYADLDKEIKD